MDHPHKDNVAVELTEAGSATSSTNVKTVGNTVAEKFRGTSADQHEMSVMGKQQVLRVNCSSLIAVIGLLTFAAKLQLSHYARLRVDMRCQLGRHLDVSITLLWPRFVHLLMIPDILRFL